MELHGLNRRATIPSTFESSLPDHLNQLLALILLRFKASILCFGASLRLTVFLPIIQYVWCNGGCH
jgi:hypothetical protein